MFYYNYEMDNYEVDYTSRLVAEASASDEALEEVEEFFAMEDSKANEEDDYAPAPRKVGGKRRPHLKGRDAAIKDGQRRNTRRWYRHSDTFYVYDSLGYWPQEAKAKKREEWAKSRLAEIA